MRKCLFLVSVSLVILALSGCVSTLPTTQVVERQHLTPSFDNSHAILIEKAVKDLDIMKLVKDYVRPAERIVIASIEVIDIRDRYENSLIDDSFISNITNAGFTVLERDKEMLYKLSQEQGKIFDSYALDRFPYHPIYTLLYRMQEQGLDYLNPEVVKNEISNIQNVESAQTIQAMSTDDLSKVISFYSKLKDEYLSMINTERSNVRMIAADVIISYRVLECGIVIDLEKKKEMDDTAARELWTYHYKRNALARLAVRITDAKTGEIRIANVLESKNSDTIDFKQTADESDSQFIARMNAYDKILSAYHFTYYEQQLPNQYGTSAQKISESDISKATIEKGGLPSNEQRDGTASGTTTATTAAVSTNTQSAVAPQTTNNAALGATLGVVGGLALLGILIAALATSP